MSKVIEKLTKQQEAKIPQYVEAFKAKGLSVSPTDRAKAEDAIRRSYAYMHKKDKSCSANPEIIWADSPFVGQVLAAKYNKGTEDITATDVTEMADKASFGSFEAYWVSTYSYIANELPVEKDELICIVEDIIDNCGVYWTFEDLVVLTPKPVSIKMKNDKLHCEDGPAILYPDGRAIYAVNGELKESLVDVLLSVKNA